MSSRNLFEAGTYAVQAGFARAIACYAIEETEEKNFRFLLVNIEAISDTEEEAAVNAHADLRDAYAQVGATGRESAMAEHLSDLGYCRLEERAPEEA